MKFADRERLLEAVLRYQVNWRDFHTGTDRQGITFYYPKSEIVPALEKVGEQADNTSVNYGTEMSLSSAYSAMISNLARFLAGEITSFEPFVYVGANSAVG